MIRMPSKSTLRFSKGSIIVKEGELDPMAYIILTGRVEVYKQEKGHRFTLARLGRGQIFGEMGLILERPRTASVVALEDTVVRCVDIKAFNHLLRRKPQAIFPLLRVLFERLRTMNTKYLQAAGSIIGVDISQTEPRTSPEGPKALMASRRALVLKGKTRVAEWSLGNRRGSVVIQSFPFKIGRKMGGFFSDVMSYNNLLLRAKPPYHISRNHCSINKDSEVERYYVQDRGSTLGTVVNGQRIGGKLQINEAELDRKTNELILGLPNSPYKYEIVFEDVGT